MCVCVLYVYCRFLALLFLIELFLFDFSTFLYLLHLFSFPNFVSLQYDRTDQKVSRRWDVLGKVYKTRDDSFLQDPKFDCFVMMMMLFPWLTVLHYAFYHRGHSLVLLICIAKFLQNFYRKGACMSAHSFCSDAMQSRRPPVRLVLCFFVYIRPGIIHRIGLLPLEIADTHAEILLIEGIRPSCAFVHQTFRPPQVMVFFRVADVPGKSLFCCGESADWIPGELV